jgi:hypothetical protein
MLIFLLKMFTVLKIRSCSFIRFRFKTFLYIYGKFKRKAMTYCAFLITPLNAETRRTPMGDE